MRNTKITVVKKELLTDCATYGSSLAMGILSTFQTESPIVIVIGAALLVIMLASFFLRRIKTDPWDEMTREYYNKARKFTLLVVNLSIMLTGIYLVISRDKIIITSSSILIILGVIGLIQLFSYVWIEHKNSKGLED